MYSLINTVTSSLPHADDALQELRQKGLAASSKKVQRLGGRHAPANRSVYWNLLLVLRKSLLRTDCGIAQAERNAAQGLIGLSLGENAAALVEVGLRFLCALP